MSESEEELNSLLLSLKEQSEKVDLKFNIKNLRLWHTVPSFHANIRGKSGSSDKFSFLDLPNH